MGAVTLATMAAVTGSRYSLGGCGFAAALGACDGVALHERRHSDTRMRTSVRISEVDSVSRADEQLGGVADLECRRILALLEARLELQQAAVPLVIQVTVWRVEVRGEAGIRDFTLRQQPGPETPGAKQRVAGVELRAEDFVGVEFIVPHHDLIEVIGAHDARSEELNLGRAVLAVGAWK